MNHRGGTLGKMVFVLLVLGVGAYFAWNHFLRPKNIDREYEQFLIKVEVAMDAYLERKKEDFPELDTIGGYTFIELQELLDEKLLDKLVIDPSTNKMIDALSTVKVVVATNGKKNYTVTKKKNGLHSYVQDRLVFWLDGYQNRNATEWIDLIHGTKLKANGAIMQTSNHSFAFRDNYMVGDGKWEIHPDYTVEIVYRPYEFQNSKMIFYNILEFSMQKDGTMGFTFHPDTMNGYGMPYNPNKVHTFAAVNNLTTGKRQIWLDGISMNAGDTIFITSAKGSISLGTKENPLMGEVYAIRVYDRILNSAELEKNYELDKERCSF